MISTSLSSSSEEQRSTTGDPLGEEESLGFLSTCFLASFSFARFSASARASAAARRAANAAFELARLLRQIAHQRPIALRARRRNALESTDFRRRIENVTSPTERSLLANPPTRLGRNGRLPPRPTEPGRSARAAIGDDARANAPTWLTVEGSSAASEGQLASEGREEPGKD